jgi:hypothetical protein
LTTKSLGKCTYKLDDINAYSEEKSAAKKLEQMINLQKQVIKGMIDDNSISIPKTINAEEFANIIKTARFKELRIMEKT